LLTRLLSLKATNTDFLDLTALPFYLRKSYAFPWDENRFAASPPICDVAETGGVAAKFFMH
jgi:hypothetical protein